MDLETENRVAAILMKEAAELRRQAQSEGALAYLRQPTVRSRPNSRFLTATVRGVQQANRVVEVNEMWRSREKERELEKKLKGGKHRSYSRTNYKDDSEFCRSTSRDSDEVDASSSARVSHSSRKRKTQDSGPLDDEGLRDDEVEEFLQSRAKRGRGAVGSRMDETGPYLPSQDLRGNESPSPEDGWKKARIVLGPEKPSSLKYRESSDDESPQHKRDKAKSHSSKHKSKEKSKDKKKKRREDKEKRKYRKRY